jgi:hypothetical protein
MIPVSGSYSIALDTTPEAETVTVSPRAGYMYRLALNSGIHRASTDCSNNPLGIRAQGLFLVGCSCQTLLLHHGLDSFGPEPTCALCIGFSATESPVRTINLTQSYKDSSMPLRPRRHTSFVCSRSAHTSSNIDTSTHILNLGQPQPTNSFS